MCWHSGDNKLYAVNHLDEFMSIDVTTARATLIGSPDGGVGVNGLYDLACPPPSSSPSSLVYSYTSVRDRLVAIDASTGRGRVVVGGGTDEYYRGDDDDEEGNNGGTGNNSSSHSPPLPHADAVSMDFLLDDDSYSNDDDSNASADSSSSSSSSLWMLQDGKLLLRIDVNTGAVISRTPLDNKSPADDAVPQRHGSFRRRRRKRKRKGGSGVDEEEDYPSLYSAVFETSEIWVVGGIPVSAPKSVVIERNFPVSGLQSAYALAFAPPPPGLHHHPQKGMSIDDE